MKAATTALLLAAAAAGAPAQEFSRLLACEGSFAPAGAAAAAAHLDLALRANNRTALVQRSNVLPVGERLAYMDSPASYTMTYRLAAQGSTVVGVAGWLQNTVLVLLPDLRRLNRIRLSVDRQTGAAEGLLLNEREQELGRFALQCRARSADELAAPKL